VQIDIDLKELAFTKQYNTKISLQDNRTPFVQYKKRRKNRMMRNNAPGHKLIQDLKKSEKKNRDKTRRQVTRGLIRMNTITNRGQMTNSGRRRRGQGLSSERQRVSISGRRSSRTFNLMSGRTDRDDEDFFKRQGNVFTGFGDEEVHGGPGHDDGERKKVPKLDFDQKKGGRQRRMSFLPGMISGIDGKFEKIIF